jgi:hypothetical protein
MFNFGFSVPVIAIRPFGGEATAGRQSEGTDGNPTGINELMTNEQTSRLLAFSQQNLLKTPKYLGILRYFQLNPTPTIINLIISLPFMSTHNWVIKGTMFAIEYSISELS